MASGWSKAALAEAMRRVGKRTAPAARSHGRYRNGLEAAVAEWCASAHERWGYESMRIRIDGGARKAAWFTPDFWTLSGDGMLTIYEAKGHMREAAWVRLRVLAGMGFRVFVVRGTRQTLQFEEV